VICITSTRNRRTYVYDNEKRADDGDLEEIMVIRKLAAISIELLVLAIGAAIAAPYFLILASPFIGK
jgi:hypothetical protein